MNFPHRGGNSVLAGLAAPRFQPKFLKQAAGFTEVSGLAAPRFQPKFLGPLNFAVAVDLLGFYKA